MNQQIFAAAAESYRSRSIGFAFHPLLLCLIRSHLPDAVFVVVGHEERTVIHPNDVVRQIERVALFDKELDLAVGQHFLNLTVFAGCRQHPQIPIRI